MLSPGILIIFINYDLARVASLLLGQTPTMEQALSSSSTWFPLMAWVCSPVGAQQWPQFLPLI